MKFSIVVPSFNQGDYIAATLDSILNLQNGYPTEVIINDGGSSDQTVEILRRYDGQLSWSSKSDFGQTDAINKGLRRAGGEIFAYLNSDDVYLPGALETVAGYFAAHPDCDLVYGDASHLHPDGSFMEAYPTAPWDYGRLFAQCYLCQPAVFWRRRLHRQVGYFDERLDLAMDYEFWLRAGRAAVVHYLPGKPLAGSRLHKDAKTLSQRVPVHREILGVVRQYARQAPDCYTWLKHLSSLLAIEQGFPPSTVAEVQRVHAIAFSRNLLVLAEEFKIELNHDLLDEINGHLGLNLPA